jgi:hypothetical protein
MALTVLTSKFPSKEKKKAANHKTVLPAALHCTQGRKEKMHSFGAKTRY